MYFLLLHILDPPPYCIYWWELSLHYPLLTILPGLIDRSGLHYGEVRIKKDSLDMYGKKARHLKRKAYRATSAIIYFKFR